MKGRRETFLALVAISGLLGCSDPAPHAPPPAEQAKTAPRPAPPTPPEAPPKSKLAPAQNDGLTLAERIAKRKAEEDKLAAELASQEKERLLAYDKIKLPQHLALAKFIAATRKALDQAASKAKGKPDAQALLDKVQQAQKKPLEAQEKLLHGIDPKGGNSNIVTDEDVSLGALSSDYVNALGADLKGDPKPLQEQREELDKRMKKINDWLSEVKAAKKKK